MKKIFVIICFIFLSFPQAIFASADARTNNLPPLLSVKFHHADVDYSQELSFLAGKINKENIKLKIEAKFALDEKLFTQTDFKLKIEEIIKKLIATGIKTNNIEVKAVRTNLVTVSEIKIFRIF